MALALRQSCPIHPHERDAAGNVLDAFKHKLKWSCWEAFHDGEPFEGKQPIFGQLVYYVDDKADTLQPRTAPGFFVGWRLESGLRYRNTILVYDYELARNGTFRWASVLSIPEKEVYVPPELVFPFAEAHERAIKNMQSQDEVVLPALADMPLPFADEAGEEGATRPRFALRRFRCARVFSPSCEVKERAWTFHGCPFGAPRAPGRMAHKPATLRAPGGGSVDGSNSQKSTKTRESEKPCDGGQRFRAAEADRRGESPQSVGKVPRTRPP